MGSRRSKVTILQPITLMIHSRILKRALCFKGAIFLQEIPTFFA